MRTTAQAGRVPGIVCRVRVGTHTVYLPKFLEWVKVPIAQPGKPTFEDVLGRRERDHDKGTI